MTKPLVSIIIVSFNSKHYLSTCLQSIYKNNYPQFEIIVADNCSNDGTVNFLKKQQKQHSNLKFISLKKNYGPAIARNKAAKICQGEIIGFLDADTKVEKNWIAEAVKSFISDKNIGCLQCKLLMFSNPSKFDYAGDYLNQYGFLKQRALFKETDAGQYDFPVEIFAAKSAGMFIKKNVFNKTGGFDKDYFIYMEETDLCWRSWLLGYKTVFCPGSVVYHRFSSSFAILGTSKTIFNVRFHGVKNYILTLIKNLERKSLIKILPLHVFIWLGLAFFLFLKLQISESFLIIKGIAWNIIHIKSTLQKRKTIQNCRKQSDHNLFKIILKKQNIIVKIEQYFSSEKFIKNKRSV